MGQVIKTYLGLFFLLLILLEDQPDDGFLYILGCVVFGKKLRSSSTLKVIFSRWLGFGSDSMAKI